MEQVKIVYGKVFGDDPSEMLSMPSTRVAVDTETTGLTWMDDCLGISLAWMELGFMRSCYIHVGREDMFSISQKSVNVSELMATIFVRHIPVFHTAGFDVRILYKTLGFVPSQTEDVVDLFQNTEYNESHSLAKLCVYHGVEVPGWVVKQKKMRATLKESASDTIAKYARWDAEATLQLRQKVNDDKYDFGEKDRKFHALVWRMVERGLPVNRSFIEDRLHRSRVRMTQISQRLRINPDSPKQVAQLATQHDIHLENTKKETLKRYANYSDMAEVIEYRELSKAIGSWYEPILDASRDDGRLHAIINPFGTTSYRMSARDPNIQAIPMKDRGTAFGSLMGIFKSEDPDRQLVQIDLKQAEVRMAAMLASDDDLAGVLNGGQDPYKAMSKRMYGTEEHRQRAKSATLAAIYEIGPSHFSEANGISYDEAKEVLDTFRMAFPMVRKASYDKRNFVERFGYVKLYTGRRRFFGPDEPSYKGFNQQVQGSVAELMADGMLAVEEQFGGEIELLLQIHDSIIFEIDKGKDGLIDEIGNTFYKVVPEILWSRTKERVELPTDKEIWQ